MTEESPTFSQQFKEMYMGDFAADAERANKIADLAARYHITMGQGPRGHSASRLLRELFEEASWCGISRQEIQRAIFDPLPVNPPIHLYSNTL